jgi:hypothetical protein
MIKADESSRIATDHVSKERPVGRIGSPLPRARVLTREWTVIVEPGPPAKGDTVRVPGYGQIPTGATDSRAPTCIFPTQVGTWASGSIEDTEGWGSGLSVTLESELGMIATRETDWLEQRRATLAKKKAKDL